MIKSHGFYCGTVWIILVLASLVHDSFAQSDPAKESEAARNLWNLAIAAKGGRERLHAVQNLLMTRVNTGCSPENECELDELFVFPDKKWSYVFVPDKYPGGRKEVSIWDFGRNIWWTKLGKVSVDISDRRYSSRLPYAQYYLLLESAWIQPIPMSKRTGKIEGTKYDVVRARIPGEIDVLTENSRELVIDYFLDRKTRLPVSIRVVRDGEPDDEGSSIYTGYKSVDGILLPTEIRRSTDYEKFVQEFSYQINIPVDVKVFDGPITQVTRRYAWRLTK